MLWNYQKFITFELRYYERGSSTPFHYELNDQSFIFMPDLIIIVLRYHEQNTFTWKKETLINFLVSSIHLPSTELARYYVLIFYAGLRASNVSVCELGVLMCEFEIESNLNQLWFMNYSLYLGKWAPLLALVEKKNNWIIDFKFHWEYVAENSFLVLFEVRANATRKSLMIVRIRFLTNIRRGVNFPIELLSELHN